ncbi:hypothetical protein ACQR13_21635 [Bradyrhizobium sp. HKCCYLRH3059]|uniref:hypothetical protein n=1 Tax=Bradyrhizobium sp. HKCCYLRH3059 TaxID=3420745 RepID=UPI003EC0057B
MQMPIALDQLKRQHRDQDYIEMVKFVRNSMKLELRVRVGLVSSGGPSKAPAWVSRPVPMPSFGTPEFRQTTATIYLRRSFLQQSSCAVVTMAIAHELAHLVLDSTSHPLHGSEQAVDLTAMLLGYRDIYLDGGRYNEIRPRSVHAFIIRQLSALFLRTEVHEIYTVGYLSPEEIQYAGKLLGGSAKIFDPSTLMYTISESLFRMALVGAIFLSIFLAIFSH